MPEISELLQKLRPLDAPTYENICKWGLNWNHPDEAVLSEYIIQGEVQRAIAATELHLLQSQYEDDGQYYAEISRIVPGYDGDCWNEKHLSLIAMGDGPSPCHALLSAYISCLESHP